MNLTGIYSKNGREQGKEVRISIVNNETGKFENFNVGTSRKEHKEMNDFLPERKICVKRRYDDLVTRMNKFR